MVNQCVITFAIKLPLTLSSTWRVNPLLVESFAPFRLRMRRGAETFRGRGDYFLNDRKPLISPERPLPDPQDLPHPKAALAPARRWPMFCHRD